MTVVSSKEFVSNQTKYYNLAVNEDIIIRRGKNMFQLMYRPGKKNIEDKLVFEPDGDFYNSVSIDELREETCRIIKKVHARRNEGNSITENI